MSTPTPIWLIAILALVAVGGLYLLYWSLFADRAKGRKRCPKCWYEVGGIPNIQQCPECGHALNDSKLARTRRRWPLAITTLVLLITVTLLTPRSTRQWVTNLWNPAYTDTSRTTINGYTIIHQDAADMANPVYSRVLVRRGMRTLYDSSKGITTTFRSKVITDHQPGGQIPLPPPGTDITGDSIPDIVIEHWSGGASCCMAYTVIQLGDSSQGGFKHLADLSDGFFTDDDFDGVLEFNATERTFAYRWTSGADSPYPSVIHRFTDGRYRVSTDLMRAPLPDINQVRTSLHDQLNDTSEQRRYAFSSLLNTCVDLIYTGHESEARFLFSEFLPQLETLIQMRPADFLADFDQALAQSPFANDLEPLRQRNN